MSSISVSDSTKAEWDDLKPDDLTHDEFAQEVIATYKTFNGEPVDVEELAGELEKTLIPMVEVAAFRGSKEYNEGEE